MKVSGMTRRIALGVVILALVACGQDDADDAEVAVDAAEAAAPRSAAVSVRPRIEPWGLDLSAVDPSVEPGDDFYRYANGNWLDSAIIPEGYRSWGPATELFRRTEGRVRDLVAAAAIDPATSPARQLVGNYYAAYLDTDRIDVRGLSPLEPALLKIRTLSNHRDIARYLAAPDAVTASPIRFSVDRDPRAPQRPILSIAPDGLGLDPPDAYADPEFEDHRTRYRAYLTLLAEQLDLPDPDDRAAEIVALEQRLAAARWAVDAAHTLPFAEAVYSRDELEAFAPGLPWAEMLDALGVTPPREVLLREDTAIAPIADIFAATPVETWRTYLAIHTVRKNADILPEAIREATPSSTDFHNAAPRDRPRWEQGLAATDDALGQAVGALYVEEFFPAAQREAADQLAREVHEAYRRRIAAAAFLSEPARARSLDKLASLDIRIGHPQEADLYPGLELRKDDAFGNRQRLAGYRRAALQRRLSAVADTEWSITPHTPYAYYSRRENAIYFPAAMLQPPFFDPAADPAVNYGAIGAIIGHEIGHAFDAQGRMSDAVGMPVAQWDDESAAAYDRRTLQLMTQLDPETAGPGDAMSWPVTAETVSDVTGLSIALDAYRRSLDGEPAPVLDGFTGDQRFFLSWAQIWRRAWRAPGAPQSRWDEQYASPVVRTNLTVRNQDAWYEAFRVEPDDDLHLPPADRVNFW